MNDPQRPPEKEPRAPGLWQVLQSVGAAFFGVQTGRNRERDFKHGKAVHFIVVGLVMTVVFVLLVIGLVQLVLRSAAV